MKFDNHQIEWNPEKVDRIWDFYASNPSYRDQFFGAQSGKYVAQHINRSLKFSRLDNILDFGCGLGDVIDSCLPYLKHGQYIYATAFAPKTIDIVNSRFETSRAFKKATLTRSFPCDYEEGVFDLVIITEVVEHLNDDELDALLKECARLLKFGGYLFATTPNDEDYDANKVVCPDCGCIFHRWQHLRTWTAEPLRNKMEEYALATEMVEPIAWASDLRKMLTFIKPLPKLGLVYAGKKI